MGWNKVGTRNAREANESFGWDKHHSHPHLVSQISANNYIDYMKNLFEYTFR